MNSSLIHEAMALLSEMVKPWQTPAVTIVSQREGDPFKVLISCILSLRTHDRTTGPASVRLFALAPDPRSLVELSMEQIEEAIYPVGFYRKKALQIKELCNELIKHHNGQVPDSIDELLCFKGVGRKTANLVVTLGFNRPGICVDTHVHRICNRWGYVQTKTPEETEFVLRAQLPREYWLQINDLLVTFGQNLCKPISPLCSMCRLNHLCDRVGVARSR